MAQARKQKTINVNGHIIKMVVNRKSRGGHGGYSATVTDNRGNEMKVRHINVIQAQEAQDYAFVKFVKQYA